MKRKLFNMHVLIVSLIVFMYTFSIIASVTYFNYQNFAQKVSYDNEISLTSNADNIDKWFNNLMQFSSNLTSKPLIQEYLTKSGSSYANFPAVYDELVNTQQINFQSDLKIGITKSDDSKIVSHDGYYTILDYLKLMNIDINAYRTFLANDLEEQYRYTIVAHQIQDEHYLTLLERKVYTQIENELLTFLTFPVDELVGSSLLMNSDLYIHYGSQTIPIHVGHIDRSDNDLNSLINSIEYSSENKEQRSLSSYDENSLTAYVIASDSVSDMNYIQLSSMTLFDLFTQDFMNCFILIIFILIVLGGSDLFLRHPKSLRTYQDHLKYDQFKKERTRNS
ncbi:hypothetical protein ACFP65_09520 [Marinilactibacillus sp. GCM10026970]|uniref:hypothetical protein n=1 Tax=Marinilactibacillus sp. GCM10026970 TaxID=3252642 RepID=UPI0036111232